MSFRRMQAKHTKTSIKPSIYARHAQYEIGNFGIALHSIRHMTPESTRRHIYFTTKYCKTIPDQQNPIKIKKACAKQAFLFMSFRHMKAKRTKSFNQTTEAF